MRKIWMIGVIFFLVIPLVVGAASGDSFTRDLYFGMRGDADVVRMQEFLRTQGYFSYPQSTGNYFGVTLAAVRQWQKAQGISPVGGFFGSQSRAIANKIIAVSPVSTGAAVLAPPVIIFSSDASPYKDKIFITSLSGYSSSAENEYMEIENRSPQERITITGFRVENATRESVTIPTGYRLPGFEPAPSPIVLEPGDRAMISIGKQERQMNFRENLCTGYFDETSIFSPSLNHSCPRIQPARSVIYTDQCIRAIESVGTCRMLHTDQFIGSACQAFVDAHLNYVGCVADSRGRPDFYSRRWLIWMQRDQQLFRDLVERVTLRDREGKVVAEYSY
ncbi:MAG: peptidoglycan-binding protein [Candidatus Sungiibacteriota bacterium]